MTVSNLTGPLPELANLVKTVNGKSFRLGRIFTYVPVSVQEKSVFAAELGGSPDWCFLERFYMVDAEFMCETVDGVPTGFVQGYVMTPDTGVVNVPALTSAKQPKFIREYTNGNQGKFIVSYHGNNQYSRYEMKKAEKVYGSIKGAQVEPTLYAWGSGLSAA